MRKSKTHYISTEDGFLVRCGCGDKPRESLASGQADRSFAASLVVMLLYGIALGCFIETVFFLTASEETLLMIKGWVI